MLQLRRVAHPDARPSRQRRRLPDAALLGVSGLRARASVADDGPLSASHRRHRHARDARPRPPRAARIDRRRTPQARRLRDRPRRQMAQRRVRFALPSEPPRLRRVRRIFRRMAALLSVESRSQRLVFARRRPLPHRRLHRRGDRLHPPSSRRSVLSPPRLQRAAFSVRGNRGRRRAVQSQRQLHDRGQPNLRDDRMHGSRNRARARRARSQRPGRQHARDVLERQRPAVRRQGRDVHRPLQLRLRRLEDCWCTKAESACRW